ncbi:hypothetical protein KR018_002734 [Drosophila ironensis]|nr:hypothetical protein KR018_002734 [Drosophila ironensis]
MPTLEPQPSLQLGAHTCRLCHREASAEDPNIFDSPFSREAQTPISGVCQSVWDVTYERHDLLPEHICADCVELLEDAHVMRQEMQERERDLREQLKEVIRHDPKYRPGLNGNPGEFEAEEGCIIIDVDPDKLSETSEDDFPGSEADYDEEEEEDEEEDFEDDEEEDVNMPLGMDAAQMAQMQEDTKAAEVSEDVTAGASMQRTRAFLCQYCDLGFTQPGECQEHERTAHDLNAPYGCAFCSLKVTTRPDLIAHIKTLHDHDRPYVCAHCKKGFVRRSDLKKHTIVHTGVRPFTCNVCSKSFSRNTNLTKHMRIHSGVKPFVCQHCPRSFQTAIEMTRHARSHSEVKPFRCGRCPYSFSRKDKLLSHQLVHTKRDAEQQQIDGEAAPFPLQQQLAQAKAKPVQAKSSRNFKCDVCDRVFQRERDLQRHRALHMDTLFACKICNLVFNRREQLHRHELEVHGPSYTCGICCISFLHQSELENHLKVHQLQHKMAQSEQEAINAAAQPAAVKAPALQEAVRPTAAELSFYSNMIPTMNLGFYSETRPEE